MTEYSSPASINRILGALAGYSGYDSNGELPFDKLDTNPYQLILLDEFEKCDRSVQRLFMSVFEEGRMKTNSGKEIDFSKAIIIATTNAGFSGSAKSIGFGNGKEKGITVCDLTDFFDAELLNRFSHRYTFRSISREVYVSIVRDTYERETAMLECSRLDKAARKFFSEKPDERLIEMLVRKSYQPQFGARPARLVVTEFIDTVLSGALSGSEDRNVFAIQWQQAV